MHWSRITAFPPRGFVPIAPISQDLALATIRDRLEMCVPEAVDHGVVAKVAVAVLEEVGDLGEQLAAVGLPLDLDLVLARGQRVGEREAAAPAAHDAPIALVVIDADLAGVAERASPLDRADGGLSHRVIGS